MKDNIQMHTPVTARLSSGILSMDRLMPTAAKKPNPGRRPADLKEPVTMSLDHFPARVEPSVHPSGTDDGATVYHNFSDRLAPVPTNKCVASPRSSISTTRDTLQS